MNKLTIERKKIVYLRFDGNGTWIRTLISIYREMINFGKSDMGSTLADACRHVCEKDTSNTIGIFKKQQEGIGGCVRRDNKLECLGKSMYKTVVTSAQASKQ